MAGKTSIVEQTTIPSSNSIAVHSPTSSNHYAPAKLVSPAGLSPATWSLGHSGSVFELWGQKFEPPAGLFHQLTPSAFQSLKGNERAGPLDLLRVQEFEMVRASGNAPELGTDLVRLRL